MPIEHLSTAEAQYAPLKIEELAQQHYVFIQHLAYSILDDPHEAADMTQETFLTAQRALHSFRGEAHPRTWLARITINLCRAQIQKRKRRALLANVLQSLHLVEPPAPSPEGITAQNETYQQLWQAVDALDEKHRLPVLLRYLHQMSVTEIAAILNLSEGTVHSQLHYARKKLQNKLSPFLSGDNEP
ncbi:MAG: hypothetical protein OHK0052_23730 [Anaerolineales bacterium]